jgi:hypothetical protein
MTWVFLSFVVLILAIAQPSRERIIPALIYALFQWGYLVASFWLDGGMLYFMGAFASLSIMGILLSLKSFPDVSVAIHRICIAEIFINATGWSLWWNYQEVQTYNIAALCIQIWVIIALTRKDNADAGGYEVDSWLDRLRIVVGERPHTVSGRGQAT